LQFVELGKIIHTKIRNNVVIVVHEFIHGAISAPDTEQYNHVLITAPFPVWFVACRAHCDEVAQVINTFYLRQLIVLPSKLLLVILTLLLIMNYLKPQIVGL
jgi:hypothetical protein